MRKHRRQSAAAVEGLRLAIDCLPVATREAMLRGVRENDRIIAGAYTDEHGGVCPMLAAHRSGGRTKFLSFAKSWDRFTRAGARNKRVATPREIRILIGHLEASLASVSGQELDRAISEHHALAARSRLSKIADRRSGSMLGDEADPRGVIRARRLRSRVRALRPVART